METNYTNNEKFSHSMLDVLLTNLERSGMKIHLYRIMYIGEHELDFKPIEEYLKNTLKKSNLDFRDETLYGLMLYYSKYYILTLEGSEESILRHADLLLNNEGHLGETKVLIMLRVNQRMLACPWQALKLAAALEPSGRLMEAWQEARVCVAKLHRLAGVLASREASMGGPLSDRSLLPEPRALGSLVRGPLLLGTASFVRRAASPPPALRHDDHVWPPNDPI